MVGTRDALYYQLKHCRWPQRAKSMRETSNTKCLWEESTFFCHSPFSLYRALILFLFLLGNDGRLSTAVYTDIHLLLSSLHIEGLLPFGVQRYHYSEWEPFILSLSQAMGIFCYKDLNIHWATKGQIGVYRMLFCRVRWKRLSNTTMSFAKKTRSWRTAVSASRSRTQTCRLSSKKSRYGCWLKVALEYGIGWCLLASPAPFSVLLVISLPYTNNFE